MLFYSIKVIIIIILIVYYGSDDNYINIHLPVEDDYEIICFSFKPINKCSITGKQFKIINCPYKMYIIIIII